MPYFIVEQLKKVGRGENAIYVPIPVKTIGNAPNTEGKTNADGEIPEFISIPPIVRVYLGNSSWGSPGVMPSAADLDEMNEKPVVHTITLNPRNGNFNWHFGLGAGTRIDVDPNTNIERVEKLKPISGPASYMKTKLAERIGYDLAEEIVSMMVVEMVNLNEAKRKAAQKRAAKPRKVKDDPKPVDPGRAEVDARRRLQAERNMMERLEAEARRVA